MTATLEEPPLNGHERRRAATREKVLVATRRLLTEHGREALTVVAVARAAGVSEGTIYKIFSNRDDLAAAAMLTVSDLWIDSVAATPTTLHPLRRILRAHLEIRRGMPEEEVLLTTMASHRPRTTTEIGLRTQAQEMMARSCAAGLTRSRRSKLSETEALLWSNVYVAALRTLRLTSTDDDMAVLAQYIDTLTAS